jgi:RNA polymerase sigma-70 factor (ECF subfamily)
MSAIALMVAPQLLAESEEPRTMVEVVFEEPPEMDEQAFYGLYARTARSLRAYLGRVTGNRPLADDLLQETYFRFLRSSFNSDDESHQKNFLYRIATNLMRDHFRRPKREVGEVPEVGVEENISREVERRSDVGEALALLGPRDRAMLWLAYVEGSSHEEIAASLGLKPSSIRSMLHRARQRFAAILRARGLQPPATVPRVP